jgi:ABC-type transport system substrate-binding protein
MKKKRFLRWLKLRTLIFPALFMVIAAGCSNKQNEQPAGVSPAAVPETTTAAPAEAKVLKVRFYDDPAGFDPATIFRIENENIAFNIFSGLTSYDSKTMEIIPDLAESWETPDNKVWTFHLRKGVQWQKGYGEFTSKDVLYTYQRIIDPATGSPYATEFSNIEKVETPDDYTVVYHLHKPDGNFLHVVANYHQGQIVKKEAIEKAGTNVNWEPVGTGPYMMESIDPSSQIVFVRHDHYYKGPAPIEKIIFNIIKDEQTAMIALQNGEIDVAMNIGLEENLDILEKAGYKLNLTDNVTGGVKVFNLDNPKLKDKRVRLAWAYAVDYDAIYKALSPRKTRASYNFLLDWMDVYTDDVPRYEYNPDKAKQLLKEAGYEKGITLKVLTSGTVTETAQLEQEYLSQVGIKVEFDIVDSPTLNKRRNQGDFEVSSRTLPAVNPDMILFSYLHPDNIVPKGLNGARYNNPVVTAKLEAARAEVDPTKRKELYAEVQRIALEDLAYLPTSNGSIFWPSQQWVEGVVVNKLAQVNFYEVDITK